MMERFDWDDTRGRATVTDAHDDVVTFDSAGPAIIVGIGDEGVLVPRDVFEIIAARLRRGASR